MLASCIMLTRNRRHLAPVAIECYRRQTWVERELIVVDDGDDPIEDLLIGIPGARYFRTPLFATVGEKLNFACEQAAGEVLVTWDDDDWYADERITDQVERLIGFGKDLTGYHTILFHDGERASQYRNPPVYPTGTSQVYRKAFWAAHRCPPLDVGYDNELWKAAGGSVVSVHGGQMLVARIHRSNVSGRRPTLGSEMWPYVPLEMLPAEFFEAIR